MTTSREIEVTIVHYVKKKAVEKDHLLDINDYLLPQITRICSRYDILEDEAEKYTLQVHQQDEEPFVLSNDVISKQVKLREGDKLELVVKPEVRVANVMDVLDQENLSQSIKKDVFLLRKELLDDVVFAESFIRNNGVQVLAKVVNKTFGNIQAYSLGCLKSALSYVSGMNVINDSPEIASDVFKLIDHEGMESSSKQTTIYRNALEILIVFCNYLDNGFTLVHNAAKEVARSRDPPSEPYRNLVYLLDSGDVDVLVDTVTLMNLMLSKAPSKYKQKRLLHRWRQLDIPSKLAESPINDRNWRTQLDVFQTSTGIVIPKSWYEVDILQKQNSEISRENDGLKRQLFFYHQQEPYVTTLKSELRRCYDELKNAVNQGVEGVSYRAHPSGRHGTEEVEEVEIPSLNQEQNAKDQQQRSAQKKDSVIMKDQEIQTSILMCEIMGIDDDEYDDMYDEYYADEEEQVPGSVEEDNTVLIRKSELEELKKVAEQIKQGQVPDNKSSKDESSVSQDEKNSSQGTQEKESKDEKENHEEDSDEDSGGMDGMDWQMDLLTQASTQLDRLQEQIGAKEERLATLNQQIEKLQSQLQESPSSEHKEGTTLEDKKQEGEEEGKEENKNDVNEKETEAIESTSEDNSTKTIEKEESKKEEKQEKQQTKDQDEKEEKEEEEETQTETQSENKMIEEETQTSKKEEKTEEKTKDNQEDNTPQDKEPEQKQEETPSQSDKPETASSQAPSTQEEEQKTKSNKDTSDLTVDVASPVSVSKLLEGETNSPSPGSRAKMKRFNWEKLHVNKNSSTIWGQIQPEQSEFDPEQIRVLFSKQEGWEAYIDVEGDDNERKDVIRPQEEDKLLDSKRWNTLSIALHRLPAFEEIRRAVYQMDSRKLSLEQIEHIIRASPSEEEIQHFKKTLEKKGDDVKLQKPEQFVQMISEIPQFIARIRCWRFRIIIDELVNSVRKPMMNVIEASKQVKNSESLKIVLQYVLSIGNFMNDESATAFNIENLNRLETLRDRTNRVSLLQYLCDVLYKAHPEVASLPSELAKSSIAGKQGLHVAENSIRSLNLEFKRFKKNIKKVKTMSKSGDLFMEELTQFEKRADETTVATNTELHRATREFQQMLRYLGVPPSRVKEIRSEEFFDSLSTFLNNFKQYMDDPRRISPWRLQGKRIGKSGAADAMSSIVQSIKSEMANKNQQ